MPNTTAVRTAQVGAAPFFSGKNKIINGDFGVNQRSFSTATSSGYTFDRWRYGTVGGTCTMSPQTFTPGTAPVTGYESTNFAQIITSGQSATSDLTYLTQRIEDVRTFANQTITVSFWAKASTGTPKIAVGYTQNFGSGGSTGVSAAINQATISTSWARYSVSGTIASISGKTLGTSSYLELELWVSGGSDYNSRTGSMGIQSNTFQIWGVQVEAGSVATAFQTATGTIQGELAACQRYYYRASVESQPLGSGVYYAATTALIVIKLPVTMRVSPTYGSSGVNALSIYSNSARASTANTLDVASPDAITVIGTTASSTLGYGAVCYLNGASKYLEAIAEL